MKYFMILGIAFGLVAMLKPFYMHIFPWDENKALSRAYSIVITLLFSLTAVKALFFLFDYQKFQQWVAGMLTRNKGRKVILVDSLVGAFGLIVIIATLLIY